jgi:hypothetical protein
MMRISIQYIKSIKKRLYMCLYDYELEMTHVSSESFDPSNMQD